MPPGSGSLGTVLAPRCVPGRLDGVAPVNARSSDSNHKQMFRTLDCAKYEEL